MVDSQWKLNCEYLSCPFFSLLCQWEMNLRRKRTPLAVGRCRPVVMRVELYLHMFTLGFSVLKNTKFCGLLRQPQMFRRTQKFCSCMHWQFQIFREFCEICDLSSDILPRNYEDLADLQSGFWSLFWCSVFSFDVLLSVFCWDPFSLLRFCGEFLHDGSFQDWHTWQVVYGSEGWLAVGCLGNTRSGLSVA